MKYLSVGMQPLTKSELGEAVVTGKHLAKGQMSHVYSKAVFSFFYPFHQAASPVLIKKLLNLQKPQPQYVLIRGSGSCGYSLFSVLDLFFVM